MPGAKLATARHCATALPPRQLWLRVAFARCQTPLMIIDIGEIDSRLDMLHGDTPGWFGGLRRRASAERRRYKRASASLIADAIRRCRCDHILATRYVIMGPSESSPGVGRHFGIGVNRPTRRQGPDNERGRLHVARPPARIECRVISDERGAAPPSRSPARHGRPLTPPPPFAAREWAIDHVGGWL